VIVAIILSVICLLVALGGIVYLVFRVKRQKRMITTLAANAFKDVDQQSNRTSGNNEVIPDPLFSFPGSNLVASVEAEKESRGGKYQRM